MRKGFFTDDRLVAIYRGTLRLGVDLRLADKNWVYAHGDTVTLTLPKIRLLDRRFIDETRTKVFYESDAVWRGLGELKKSGLAIREEYAEYDALKHFNLQPKNITEIL